jgi:hypothetical protein
MRYYEGFGRKLAVGIPFYRIGKRAVRVVQYVTVVSSRYTFTFLMSCCLALLLLLHITQS